MQGLPAEEADAPTGEVMRELLKTAATRGWSLHANTTEMLSEERLDRLVTELLEEEPRKEPEPEKLTITELLRWHVNPLSMRYHGSPVYLVGSALHDEDPRDVDVVVVLPDELFWRTYLHPDHHIDWMIKHWKHQGIERTPSRGWMRWARDCTKQARWLTCAIGGPIVDFKTQFESEAANYTGERKLVSVPYLR